MAIAIKEIYEQDKQRFEEFLKTERKALPRLKYSPLPRPHEEVAVIITKDHKELQSFANKYSLCCTEFKDNIVTLSKHVPVKDANGRDYIFSGYTLIDGKMYIGMDEVAGDNTDISILYEAYGEFCLLTVKDGSVEMSADFFGMVQWYYYNDGNVFAACNNYHLLLLLLSAIGVKLSMNIRRSRVNIITSGFTFGSPFCVDLDVTGCRINLSYERLIFTISDGLKMKNTSLFDIVSAKEGWNEDIYEEYLLMAKEEIYNNVRAVFEHEQFKNVVIDVSGGFDSRIVFATACNLPKRLRNKIMTYTRASGTPDDMEVAAGITNMYSYKKASYVDTDVSPLLIEDGFVELPHVSRTIGTFSVNSNLYLKDYDNNDTVELTGGVGDALFGYKRIRGELDYKLGDQRLLARLGNCYLWNSVSCLSEVFQDQKEIINATLNMYNSDCLFKKFHLLYLNFRNRLLFGSSHIVEHNNFRMPVVFSKYALKSKWMYFNKFKNNEVPDEKISLDLIFLINPLLGALPFCKNNDDVITQKSGLLNPVTVNITPDNSYEEQILITSPKTTLHKEKVLKYMDNLEIVRQMLLHIYDYSSDCKDVVCGLYKVICEFDEKPNDFKTGHGREQIRKIYDVFYQMKICKEEQLEPLPSYWLPN